MADMTRVLWKIFRLQQIENVSMSLLERHWRTRLRGMVPEANVCVAFLTPARVATTRIIHHP